MSKRWRGNASLVRIVWSAVAAAAVATACAGEDEPSGDGDGDGSSGEAGMGGEAGTGNGGSSKGGSGVGGSGGVAPTGGKGGKGGSAGSSGTSGAGGEPSGAAGEGGIGPAGSGGEGPAEPCGNGTLDGSEACDDRNVAAGDGCFECAVEDGFECDDSEPSVCEDINECERATDDCDAQAMCTNVPGSFGCECNEGYFGNGRECEPEVVAVAAGGEHTCALLGTGDVRCWGQINVGQVGIPSVTQNIGDNETPAAFPPVPVGGPVQKIALGRNHTCAVLESGSVRCWGENFSGQLGYAHTNSNVGGDVTPAMAGDVNVGGTVQDIALGEYHTCALLTTGNVRCWGYGPALGYGNTDTIGDDEAPATAGDVNVGGPVQAITAASGHTCALLTTGNVRCWGWGGTIGYGNTDTIGDDESPASAGDVDVGGTVKAISAGETRTCVLLTSGAVRCWGDGAYGALGNGRNDYIGDDEPPSANETVNLGFEARAITVSLSQSCAISTTGPLNCWGQGNGSVSSSLEFVQVNAGRQHTCAVLSGNRVRCWGAGWYGRLGYANETDVLGPDNAGNVQLFREQ